MTSTTLTTNDSAPAATETDEETIEAAALNPFSFKKFLNTKSSPGMAAAVDDQLPDSLPGKLIDSLIVSFVWLFLC